MTVRHEVIFYPVGNGDTSQIILNGGKRILLDYRHQTNGEKDSEAAINLKERLKSELDSVDRDSFDVVAFTHADKDHISGSTDFFSLQYAEKYQGDDRVNIDTLWVPAAMLLEKAERDKQSEEFVIWRREAWHRLMEGRDILVFSKPAELRERLAEKLRERGESENARDHLIIDAGTIVPGFSLGDDGVEFFCHSPFIKHCEEGDVVRNKAALIFNVRFEVESNRVDYLAVGDAESDVVEDIVNTTKYHSNEDRLNWDLFNIPHHCSYLALADSGEKGDHETEPKPLVKELLLMGRKDSYQVSSSFPISNDKDAYQRNLPPHVQAKNTYEKNLREVNGRKFLVTMEQPNETKPEPIVFEITSNGLSWKKNSKHGAAAVAASIPPRAGLE